MSKLTDQGEEILDPTPVQIPIELRKSESMDERIRRIIQHSASVAAQAQGLETFDEADDFDIDDDPIDPSTPWEKDFDQAQVQGVRAGIIAQPNPLDPRRMEELRAKYTKPKPGKDIKPDTPPVPKEPPTGASE